MDATQQKPGHLTLARRLLGDRDLPAWLRLGVRWLGIMGAALGIATLWLVIVLRPTRDDLSQMIWWLVVSGVISIAIGALTFWLVDVAHLGSVRLKFALPSLLAGLVIALNILLAAHMMFITNADAQMLIAFLVFGESVALALSSSLVGTMSQAISRIALGARHLAAGEYQTRIKQAHFGGIKEFEQLAQDLNVMAESVQGAFVTRDVAEAQRRQVVAAISHDVRTPLTIMRAMIEAIDDGVVTDPEIVLRYHHAIRAEMQHLSLLIDDLFEVSRIETGAVHLAPDRLNIADIISDILEATHEQAARKQIHLTGKVGENLPTIWADARQIYRIVMNLVQNALQHTPAGGAVALLVTRQGDHVAVQVIDSGEGIAAPDLPHVFELAYRGEASRKRENAGSGASLGGTGLGLAIARGLVEAHGGHIQAISPLPPNLSALIQSSSPQTLPGTLVSFTLPIESTVIDVTTQESRDGARVP